MEDQIGNGGSGAAPPSPPSRPRAHLFVAILGLYYALYYVLFAGRVSEYMGDLLRHFAFVRRLF
jgi:hypothetical protein